MKYLPKRESNLANVQSCPSNEKKGITKITVYPTAKC